jgi:F1F0 ATPase subunit 2
MNPFMFPDLNGWAMALSLAGYAFIGLVLGAAYFQTLSWNVSLFISGSRAATSLALLIGRFVLLAGVLTLVSFEGESPLLMTGLGVLLSRSIVMRKVQAATP